MFSRFVNRATRARETDSERKAAASRANGRRGVSWADLIEEKWGVVSIAENPAKEIIMAYKLTVQEMSDVCNVSQSTIRKWIADYELGQKGKFVSTIENVEKMGNDHHVGPRMRGNLIAHYALKH